MLCKQVKTFVPIGSYHLLRSGLMHSIFTLINHNVPILILCSFAAAFICFVVTNHNSNHILVIYSNGNSFLE